MIARYAGKYRIIDYQVGMYARLKIPQTHKPSTGTGTYIVVRLIGKAKGGRNNFQCQSKFGIIKGNFSSRQLAAINEDMFNFYDRDISNNTREITLRKAALLQQPFPRQKVACKCSHLPCSNNCTCKRLGVKCTRYCHARGVNNNACTNNAEGNAYNK